MGFKHPGGRAFLLATDTFVNSWVKPLLWITERFIVSPQRKGLCLKHEYLKSSPSLLERSQREEWSGRGFYTKQPLKIKSTEVYVRVLDSPTNRSRKT